jgi:hypothetical protein
MMRTQSIAHARRARHLRVNEQRTDSVLLKSIVAAQVCARREAEIGDLLCPVDHSTHSRHHAVAADTSSEMVD